MARSAENRTENLYRCRRPQSHEFTSNLSLKKRTEKIRLHNALDILDGYRQRCQARALGKRMNKIVEFSNALIIAELDASKIQRSSNSTRLLPSTLSEGLTRQQSPSIASDTLDQHETIMEDSVENPSAIDSTVVPQLRTFHGWKRHTTHVDTSRLIRGFIKSHVSSVTLERSL